MLLSPPLPLMKSPFNSQALGTVFVRKVLGSRDKAWNRSDMGTHMAIGVLQHPSSFHLAQRDVFLDGCFSSPTSLAYRTSPRFSMF